MDKPPNGLPGSISCSKTFFRLAVKSFCVVFLVCTHTAQSLSLFRLKARHGG